MKKPVVRLVGEDGNAFMILGRCRNAAKAAGWSKEQLTEFSNKALAGNYDHLLRTVMEYFDEPGEDDILMIFRRGL